MSSDEEGSDDYDDDDFDDDDVGDERGDLSQLAAAQTKVESFSVKRKSYEQIERETKRVAEAVPGMSQPSGQLVPYLQESGALQQLDSAGCTKVIQQNFYQVEQKFGDVTVQGTRNLTIGGTQNIGQPGQPQEEEKPQTWIEKIIKRTASRIAEWTKGMVRTAALEKVLRKVQSGVKWITIKGSPGEGKTTVGYMTLGELHKSERQVCQVLTPAEFSEVCMSCTRPVIMLDDIFGNLEFDQAEWSNWRLVLHQVLDATEHRSHEKDDNSSEDEVTVILVGRDYVLNASSCDMGRLSDFLTNKVHVVEMSSSDVRDIQEKLDIWRAISDSSGIKLDRNEIDRICQISGPHGFPHVCRLFVTLRQKDATIDAEKFFKSPLEFLNETVQKFIRDKVKLSLFKEMIKQGGRINSCELENFENCVDVTEAANELVGSYLRTEEECFIFDHPSIYDSVAFHLCKYMPVFVIEKCNLSFLHERLRLQPQRNKQSDTLSEESGLVVHIPRSLLKNLAKRFALEISNQNLLQVLSHKACADDQFINEIMSHITMSLSDLLQMTDAKTNQDFFSLIASSKSPEMLMYIDKEMDRELTESELNAVLYGVCRYAASEVLEYLLETHDDIDTDVRYGNTEQSPLMIASGTRDSQFVQQVMSLQPDLTAKDKDNKTVLHYLCENGLVSAVEYVTDKHTEIDVKDLYGSPLWYACRGGHVLVARHLLEKGASVDAKTVVEACRTGNKAIVALLFEKGATVDMATKCDTPFISACEGGHMEVMKLLLDKGASVNSLGVLDQSPLHWACFRNKVQAVQCLVENGANTDSRDEDGNAPLQTAAERGFTQCVEALLKARVNVNVKNTDGDTPLHLAVLDGSTHCMHVLLKAGADTNVKNVDGNTALHAAAKFGSKECLDVLLKAGSDVKVKGEHGDTALHIAAGKGSKEHVDALLKVGADCNIQNEDGQTPLHMAVYYSPYLPDTSVCRALVKHGADVNMPDTEGNIPLHLLCRTNEDTTIDKDLTYLPASNYENIYRRLVRLLVDNRSDVNKQNNKGERALRGWCRTLYAKKSRSGQKNTRDK